MAKRSIIIARALFVGTFILLALLAGRVSASSWPGQTNDFHGFVQHKFTVQDVNCIVVEPRAAAVGKPWIWRARFFGHEPQVDIALLNKGFHVAYADVAGLFGSPKAVERWDVFYTYLTGAQGFSRKAVLEGMSRGGLIIFNWAVKNPDKVHCIYADAPVCDIRSWPGGKGSGKGSKNDWDQCLKAYGMTEGEALEYRNGPIDNLHVLAKVNIPLIHVVGDDDNVVPVSENTELVEKRYKELGGEIVVIHKKGVGHHPHSLKDPKPIVDFIIKHVQQDSKPDTE